MARVEVLMPQMGESIAEGTVSKWLKKVGDAVQRDEPLFEISTDKVDAEIPAPAAGVLAEIKVPEGQTVPVQTLVAVIETAAGAGAPVAAASPAPAPPAPPPPPPPAPPPPAAAAARAKGGDGAETVEERLRRRSTPLVRKIAAEHQVDLSTIPGTGFAGRVTKQDILSFLERGAAAGTAPPAVAPRAPAPPTGAATAPPAPPPAAPAAPAAAATPVVHPTVEPWPGDRVEPFSKIRKITADHMILSRRISAHVTSFFEVDFT